MAIVSQILKHGETANDMDSLSSLPDAILSHILTFLPEKDVVATSILCKRWQSVFLHVHEVKLDGVFLQNPHQGSSKSRSCSKSRRSYENYANRLLMLASGMRTFRLKSANLDVNSIANLWIRSSLTRNIQELDIKADSGHIPIEIFSCNPLVVLKLEGRAKLEVPKFVSLPNLKVLKLKLLTVLGGSIWKFSVGYPQLEDLQLHEISIEGVHNLHISISTLQKLFIDVMGEDFYGSGKIVLNAPNLCHLEIEVNYLFLQLSSNHSPPLFSKLKFLEMRDYDYEFDYFNKILHNAPNLERLICPGCLVDDKVEQKNHRLREIEVRNFYNFNNGGFDAGLKLIMYFLKFGVLLEKMTFVDAFGDSFKEVFASAAFKKLLLQESCSPAVQLLYRSLFD